MRLALALLLLLLPGAACAAEALDVQPRTAVISAFPPEVTALRAALTEPHDYESGGVVFTTGRIEGRLVVLFLSGVSMVNAAMTTQAALDRFNVRRIVFSGIAGGVDESLDIGDVVVAERWAQPMETLLARETADGFAPGDEMRNSTRPPFGMMYPRAVLIGRGQAAPEVRNDLPADPDLLAIARQVAARASLARCVQDQCLARAPRVVVGGVGVSGPAFVDNAAYRRYLRQAFDARLVDMESAAVAQVAYANRAPFIAFRSLSDLAGGGAGANEMRLFMALAADNSAATVRAFLKALPAD